MNRYLPKPNGWARVEDKIKLDEMRTRQETRLWTATTIVLAIGLGALVSEKPAQNLMPPKLSVGETRVEGSAAVSIPLKTAGVRFAWLLNK